MKKVVILTADPVIEVIAEQRLVEAGILEMAKWVQAHRPDCVPADGFESMWDLLPHDQWDGYTANRSLTDNEVLCEIAGRKCYDSFAERAGKKTNRDYFEHIFSMNPIHSSILYHAKITFFFAGVSRKFSHQFIRNYVGSDRDEEGSPSQESTRFTHHYGWYIAPPYIADDVDSTNLDGFKLACQSNYDEYTNFIDSAVAYYYGKHGKYPTGGDKKDIYEAGAGYLNMSAETSFVWTTNPMALRKFLKERCHGAADAEIFRFAKKLARIVFARYPNLFLGKDLDGVRAELTDSPRST